MTPTLDSVVSWETIYTVLSIVTVVTTAATVYLRMFLKNQLNDFSDRLIAQIKSEFSDKAVTDFKISELQRRTELLEKVILGGGGPVKVQ